MDRNSLIFATIIGVIVLLMVLTTGWLWFQIRDDASSNSSQATTMAHRIETAVVVRLTGTAAVKATTAVETVTALNLSLTPAPITKATKPIAPSQAALLAVDNRALFEGRQFEVLWLNDDAWPVIQAQYPLHEPPQEGRRMVLIKLRVGRVSTEQAQTELEPDMRDFRLIGDQGMLYSSIDTKSSSSCGQIPDALESAVISAGWISGTICFQVPLNEDRLMLLYGFDDSGVASIAFDLAQVHRFD